VNTFDCILMMSGGMDSTVIYYWLEKKDKKVLPLFLDYGQHCMDTELITLKSVLPKNHVKNIHVVDIKHLFTGSQSRLILEPNLWREQISVDEMHIPFRNLLFITVALITAELNGIKKVYSAFIDSNLAMEDDCSTEFFHRYNRLIELYNSVELLIPFSKLSKFEVANLGLNLNVPISKTFSCQINSKVHCGACPNCVDRAKALKDIYSRLK